MRTYCIAQGTLHMGKKSKKEEINEYVQLIHFAVG